VKAGGGIVLDLSEGASADALRVQAAETGLQSATDPDPFGEDLALSRQSGRFIMNHDMDLEMLADWLNQD
jgi:hypothetical protein